MLQNASTYVGTAVGAGVGMAVGAGVGVAVGADVGVGVGAGGGKLKASLANELKGWTDA